VIANNKEYKPTGGYKDYGTPEYAERNKEILGRQNKEAAEKEKALDQDPILIYRDGRYA
jgi:hypothetical protein